jgi:hypothetical protein
MAARANRNLVRASTSTKCRAPRRLRWLAPKTNPQPRRHPSPALFVPIGINCHPLTRGCKNPHHLVKVGNWDIAGDAYQGGMQITIKSLVSRSAREGMASRARVNAQTYSTIGRSPGRLWLGKGSFLWSALQEQEGVCAASKREFEW